MRINGIVSQELWVPSGREVPLGKRDTAPQFEWSDFTE